MNGGNGKNGVNGSALAPASADPFKPLPLLFRGLALVGLLLLTSSPARAVGSWPAGFSELLVVDGLQIPTAFAFGGADRIFIAEKAGRVRVFSGGALQAAPFIDLSAEVNTSTDRGLLGLAVHPQFPSQPYVYLAYSHDPPGLANASTGNCGTDALKADGPDGCGQRVSRVVRVTADAAFDYNRAVPGSLLVLLGTQSTLAAIPRPAIGGNAQTSIVPETTCSSNGLMTGTPLEDCLPGDTNLHSIGSLVFAPDGSLYVSLGDASSPAEADPRALRALDLDSLAGKILRVNPANGQGYSDNPFYDGDPTSNRSRVYAYGLRNPFRMAGDPLTGAVYAGDVGWNSWEEINTGRGRNFGWPCYEGGSAGSLMQPAYQLAASTQAACAAVYADPAAANLQAPRYAYAHVSGQGASAGAGSVYRATTYPPEFRDRLYVFDYNLGRIESLSLSGPLSVQAFGTGIAGGVVQVSTAPNGELYFLLIATQPDFVGQLYRLRYLAGNAPPTAQAAGSPLAGPTPLAVSFSSAGSFDPEGQPLSYGWAFGDPGSGAGNTSTLPNPVHTFTQDGAYTVTLTVTDAVGLIDRAEVVVTAGNRRPTAQILSAGVNGRYRVGAPVAFSGQGLDPEEGVLPGARLTWRVIVHHYQHVHFDEVAPMTGTSASFVALDHGDNTWFELCLTATDGAGLSDDDCARLDPETVTYTILSVPDGFGFSYDGVAFTTPLSFTGDISGTRSLSAPAQQNELSFMGWSNGGEREQRLVLADTAQTLTMTYANLTPTLGLPSAWVLAGGGGWADVPVVVADAETDAAALTLSAVSTNPDLLPASGITFIGAGPTRILRLTPTATTGLVSVQVTVRDGPGAQQSRALTLYIGGRWVFVPLVAR